MPLRLAWVALLLAACFEVPQFVDGELRCDRGRCPPGFSCATDDRCRRPGAAAIDAPLSMDGPRVDASSVDAKPVDAPPPPDARQYDAPPCTEGDRRCVAGGNLEVCVSGVFVAAVPSCASNGQTCFDPEPAGGSDAYCGTCLKGAKRCTGASPPVVQGCPGSGVWTDESTCGAGFGCVDSDGEGGPAAYCGECTTGDLLCSGNTLRRCVASRYENQDCTATAGFICFDPGAAGGTDAYCGACVKDQIVCRGDNQDQCNADGSGYVTLMSCGFGCDTSTSACCAMPDCGAAICGSAVNACGRVLSCGMCTNGFCCDGGELCCPFGRECCGNICCGPASTCCEPGFCSGGLC